MSLGRSIHPILMIQIIFFFIHKTFALHKTLKTAEINILPMPQNGYTPMTLYVAEASFGPILSDLTSILEGDLVRAESNRNTPPNVYDKSRTACYPPSSKYAIDSILIADRGGCSFTAKARHAKLAGARALIVRNTLLSMYISASQNETAPVSFPPSDELHVDECDVDCTQGSTYVQADTITPETASAGYACSRRGQTSEKLCALTPTSVGKKSKRKVCRISDDLIAMGSSTDYGTMSSGPVVPSVFASVKDGRILTEEMVGSIVRVRARWTPIMDPSSAFIWALAVIAVAVAVWRSAAPEREWLRQRAAGEPFTLKDPATDMMLYSSQRISIKAVAGALAMSSIVLVGLFILVKYGIGIVMFINIFFTIAGSSAWTIMVVRPLLERIPHSSTATWMKHKIYIPCCDYVTHSQLVGWFVSLGLMLTWFFTRHQQAAWILQDATGIVVVCLVLLQIRLPSLRLATILLCLFFLYDIFMVFITPLLFGSSVMVDVATAGQPKPIANWDCYCRLHPDDSTHCGPGDYMPILLRLPSTLDYRKGDSMLGLGDLVIPGLLMSFVVRYNYSKGYTLRPLFTKKSYWTWLVIGYAIGLLMANFAVILMNQGQPALLYLVPMTLIPTIVLAHLNGDLKGMWLNVDGSPEANGARDLFDEYDNQETSAAAPARGAVSLEAEEDETTRSLIHGTNQSEYDMNPLSESHGEHVLSSHSPTRNHRLLADSYSPSTSVRGRSARSARNIDTSVSVSSDHSSSTAP